MGTLSGMESDYPVTDALSDVDTARASTAERLATPVWYHPILGVILGATTLLVGLDLDQSLASWALVGVLGATAILLAAYTRTVGGWIGLRQMGPRSRPLWYAYAITTGALLVLAVISRAVLQESWIAWIAAGLVFLNTVVLGPRMDRRVLEDIAAGEGASQR